ncbi:uncharacterized protein [Chironomus tepperi]|uniref:uncharacterized protein n=1 Tax=Chironomus tepperi TaxID=113505 RepID=UPI00391F9B49
MKSLIAIVVFALISKTLALSAPELKDDGQVRVDDFNDEIMYRFQRFQNFYTTMNFQMREYRLDHVKLITNIFNQMMELFGEKLDFVRRASVELDEALEMKENELGGVTECLQGVINRRDRLSEDITRDVHACSLRANNTMQAQLRDVFYPTFADIQSEVLFINLIVMDALSRGNVMDDEDEIVDYLSDLYHVYTTQWPTAVTQLLKWEQTRFTVEGEFYIEEMDMCLRNPVLEYMRQAASLEYEAHMC